MIRVKCPKCAKGLTVDDAKAGAIGKCPACGERFRIPQPGPQTPAKPGPAAPARQPSPDKQNISAGRTRPAPPPAKQEEYEIVGDEELEVVDEAPKPKPPSRAAKRPPAEEEYEVVEEDFEIVEEAPKPPRKKPPPAEEDEDVEFEVVEEPPPKRRRVAKDEDDRVVAEERRPKLPPAAKRPRPGRDEDDFEDDRPRKRRRRRREDGERSSGTLIPGLDNFVMFLLGLGLLWLVLGGVAMAVPPLAFVLYGVGLLVQIAGSIWFLVVAFKDEVMHGVLCLLCGLYMLYYLATHFDETWRPFALIVIGTVMSVTASIIGGFAAQGMMGP